MRMYTDPRGEAYKQVIDLAIQNSDCFVLRSHNIPADRLPAEYRSVLQALEPYLLRTVAVNDGDYDGITELSDTYQSQAFYTEGKYLFYRCCEESGEVLKRVANRLSDWIRKLPEDLCFIKEGSGDYLISVVHEHIYILCVTNEEATELMEQITGLFLDIEAHRDLDRLLDDAIKHKTDWLYISGHEISELPDRISEVTELRYLGVFQQDLYRLPEGLFELSKLEHLDIMTADLERIPASISKLKNLKILSIRCGSSDRTGFKVKPIDEISLNYIPPEIGELEQLERLTIQYTSIKEIPPELEKLQRLKVLELRSCKIDREPAFLKNMKELKYIDVAQKWLWES